MSKTVRDSWICLPIQTDLGEFRASYSERGLAELRFPSDKSRSVTIARTTDSAQIEQWHRTTTVALNETLAGRQSKKLPPLDLSGGTEFQQDVWRAMTKIPSGQTSSYGELAKAIGNLKAVRAVGGACGANPIPVLVPCHRVLAANHKIGGFSGGLDWKRKLLEREGIKPA
jgi:methylated-DNA-[protein]-cysteine S-methyltransferase